MMKSFEINFNTIAYAFKDVIIMTVLYLALVGWLGYNLYPDDYSAFLLVVFLSTVFYIATSPVPALVLLWDYWDKGHTRRLAINSDGILIDNGNVAFSEVSKIVIVGTYQHFNPPVGVATLPYNDYFYFIKLYKNSGEEIIMTSLLGYQLDKALRKVIENDKFVQEIKTFPTI